MKRQLWMIAMLLVTIAAAAPPAKGSATARSQVQGYCAPDACLFVSHCDIWCTACRHPMDDDPYCA